MKVAFLPVILCLAVSSPAWAQAGSKLPGDVLCDDDLMICRESCSMELGTRSDNREKVTRCLYRCEQSHTVCLQRQIAKRKAAPRSSETTEKPKPPSKEELFSGAPTRYSQEETPPQTEEVAPVRRSVTRSTQLEAAPDHSPSDYPDREGFSSKGGPTREEREEATPAPASDDSKEEVEVEVAPPPPPKRVRPTNELGY